MKDYLVRVVTRDANIRGLACVTTNLVNESCRLHGTWPTAAIALGRVLTGGALMGALLKDGQRVALKFEGNGPLKKIITEADSKGNVRGYVGVPEVDLPLKNGKFDVAGAVGRAGFLTVTKDLKMKEHYQGIVQLCSSEIAEDLALYFTESEQIPSAVSLGVLADPNKVISASGGFLIQSLPCSDDATADKMIDKIINQIQNMQPVTQILQSGRTPEDLLELIFKDISIDILEKYELALKCSCSRERVEQAMIALGSEEIKSIMAQNKQTEVKCEFCRNNYVFNHDDLKALIQEIRD